MSERNILSSCIQSGDAFRTIADHVDTEDLSAQGRIIWEVVVDYYNRDPGADLCDKELLTNAVLRMVTNPKHEDMFKGLVNGMTENAVSTVNVVADFVAMKLENCGQKLAAALAGGNATEIERLMEEYNDWKQTDSLDEGEELEVYSGRDIFELLEESEGEGKRIKVYPKALNDKLGGGLLRGHHVVLFARPEMGKTMFLVNSIYGFLQQKLKVLYLGNEDPLNDVNTRLYSRLSGMAKYEIVADPHKARDRALERGYGNETLVKLTPGTPRQVEHLVRKYTPDVLIVDQLRNLQTREDNFTQSLEKAARAVRSIGQRNNCLVLSVTQAGDSASGKPVLDMGDVDSSNTGIPAQADVMIGLSGTEEDIACNRRVMSLPKNKPGNDHSFFQVQVDPHRSLMRSM